MDINQLSNLITNVRDLLEEEYKSLNTFIADLKKDVEECRIPGSKALTDGAFYLEVYGKIVDKNSECSDRRTSLSKLLIDLKSLNNQITRAQVTPSIASQYKSQITIETDKVNDYLKLLEIEQRKLDNILRYYASVQYVFSSPHYIK